MIIKYLLFIFSILFFLVFAGLIVKPVKVSEIKISEYKDPFNVARELYAKMLWKDMDKESDLIKKFSIIKKVTDYMPGFKQAYQELCSNRQKYVASNIEIKDFLKISKQGAESFDDKEMLDCYINTLTSMERYAEALNFMTQEYIQNQNTPKQDFYLNNIKRLHNESNILELTKAVETYYQKSKTYPGDILVLVNEGIIEKIPDEPYGGQYFISRQGQIKSTTEIAKDNGAKESKAHGLEAQYNNAQDNIAQDGNK
ncbi:MAG: hypothetical protein WCQ47_01710 [bacterium]